MGGEARADAGGQIFIAITLAVGGPEGGSSGGVPSHIGGLQTGNRSRQKSVNAAVDRGQDAAEREVSSLASFWGRQLARIPQSCNSSDSQCLYECRSNALQFGCIGRRSAYGARGCDWHGSIFDKFPNLSMVDLGDDEGFPEASPSTPTGLEAANFTMLCNC